MMEAIVQWYWVVQAGSLTPSSDFCPALLKSHGCFYFWCILPSQSQWKAVMLTLRPIVRESGNKQALLAHAI